MYDLAMGKLVYNHPNISKPAPYPRVERKDPTVSDKGWDRVGGFTLRDKVDFMPQKNLQEKFCACDSNLIFLCGAATMGKANPYDAKVLTPNGFVEMGSLQVGDTISGADGGQQVVLGIFEQGEKDVYGISFDDGSYAECCKEHLWKISYRTLSCHQTYCDYYIAEFKDVMQLIDTNHAVCIPYCDKIQFNEQDLPIKPYTLGVILGDGHFPKQGNPQISCVDTEILDRIKQDGYSVSKILSHTIDYIISGHNINPKVKELGLWDKRSWSKFIPDIYKMSSVESRMELLRGLMDTDGCVDTTGRLYYATASLQLAKDFQWIIRSLGGRCSMTEAHPKYKWKGEIRQGRTSYCLWPSFKGDEDIVTLSRKKERTKVHHNKRRKAIVSYKFVGRKQCRCIYVSNPDHLYIMDDFVVTHNTYGMFLKALQGIDKNGYTARMISVRLQDSKKGSSIFRDAVEVCGNFAGCEYNSSDYPTFSWKKWNSNLQLIHSNFNVDNPSEWDEFRDFIKKQQASYIAIDEATEIKQFKMFSYIFSRNRDSSGMTPCMVLSFNPENSHWSTQMLKDAGYIGDDWYLKPEMNGATRYFYLKGDDVGGIIWGDTPEQVAELAGIHISEHERKAGITIHEIIKSFTVFTGEASDNLKLIAATKGQSIGNLHAVGGTQRSILKGAYFGPIDSEELTVSRQMIHNLWENPINDDENMYATMDVSGGGEESDNCPMVIWKGLQIIAIKMFSGDPKQLVDWIDTTLREYSVPKEHFAFDATGIGYYLRGFSSGIPITANKRVLQEYDEYGNPVTLTDYYNLRSQLLGKTKVLFEKGELSCAVDKDMVLPYGKKGKTRRLIDILFDEMNVFITTTKNRKVYYRHKDEYKSKFKASPDLMDAISYRAIFELDAREKKAPPKEIPDDAYDGLYQHYGRGQRVVWV